MNTYCNECMYIRYRVDFFSGEKEAYCNLQQEGANENDVDKLAPTWCPFKAVKE